MQELAQIIHEARIQSDLTQDQFGAKYDVSGPAIFKFEKGYVRPSLELWLRMALDAGVSDRRAVLLWLKSKLPEQYRSYVPMPSEQPVKPSAAGVTDYSQFDKRDALEAAARKDKSLPKGLRELLTDEEIWSLFKPTGHEINLLRDKFGPLGKGSKEVYADALRIVREFVHSF